MKRNVLLLALTAIFPSQVLAMNPQAQHTDHQAIFRSLKEGKKKGVFTLASDDAEFRSNCICWFEGGKRCDDANCELLIHPKRDILFDQDGVSLNVGARSLVLLVRRDRKVTIYNIHDTRYGAVSLNEKDNIKEKIHVGESIVVPPESQQVSAASPFTLATLVQASPLILTLKSEMSSGDKAMWKTLVKTYASLSMIRGDHTLEQIYKNAEAYNKGSLKVR
jgi:hypothetical protein